MVINLNDITKLSIGTAQFGLNYGISNKQGKTSVEEVSKILNYAYSKGILDIDTAVAYGNSEQVLGMNDLFNFNIVSKFIDQSIDSLPKSLNNSCKNLRINTLYGYLFHRPLQLLDNPEIWDLLLKFKHVGKVKKIGFSFNNIEELEQLIDKGYFPDIIQCPYNYFDTRFENKMIELKSRGCEIHTRSTFLQGLFFMKPDELPSYFNSVKDIIQSLQIYKDNLPAMLLANSISKPFIDKVIIGVNNLTQLEDNIANLAALEDSMPVLNSTIESSIIKPFMWPINS